LLHRYFYRKIKYEMKFPLQKKLIFTTVLLTTGAFILGVKFGQVQSTNNSQEISDLKLNESFKKGEKLERGMSAWYEAAKLNMYLAFFDSEKLDELPKRIEDNLWYTIPDLYKFTSNPDAKNSDKQAAKGVLRKLVLYFYQHPRKITEPEKSDLSKEFSDQAKAAPLNSNPDSTEQKVYSKLSKGVGDNLSGLETAIDKILSVTHETDLEIQAILDQLASQHEFPYKETVWNEVTIYLPRLTGRSRWSGNDNSFSCTGEDFNLNITYSKLMLNGINYGAIQSDSVIDIRVPGKVYIDGELRSE